MSTEKFKLKFAAYLIPRKGNQVLLSLRQNTGFMDGMYGLVSGHVEEGETVEEAIIRETSEETGAIVALEALKFVFVMHRLKNEPQDDYVDIYFETHDWSDEFTNKEPEKCGGLDWFDINQLPANTIPYIADVLNSYQSGKFFASKREVTS